MKKDIGKKVIIILASMIALYVGYLASGILKLLETMPDEFGKCIMQVLSEPFNNYFNDYTPILMIICLIIFECICMLIIGIRAKKSSVNQKKEKTLKTETDEDREEIHQAYEGYTVSNIMSNEELDTKLGEETGDSADFVSIEDIEKLNHSNLIEGEDNPTVRMEEAEPEPILDNSTEANDGDSDSTYIDDLYVELYDEYTTEQLDEMIRVLKYMKNVDADTLRNMFPPSMEAGQIKDYINIFYG